MAEVVAVLCYGRISRQLRRRLRRGGMRTEWRGEILRDLLRDLGPDSGDAGQPHDVDLVFPAVHVVAAYSADLAEGVTVEALLDQRVLAVAERLRNKGAGLIFRELAPLDHIVLHGEVEGQAGIAFYRQVSPPCPIPPFSNPRSQY